MTSESKLAETAFTPGPWSATTRRGSWDWVVYSVPDLLAALKRSAEGWANALELDLLPPQHRMAATIHRDECRGAITAATGGKHEQD